MGEKRSTIIPTFLGLLFITTILVIITSDPVAGDLSDPGALVNRLPIHIIGDAQFTGANGVVSGSGSQPDPYLIENWTIEASSVHGIWIENTSSHFKINNCWVRNTGGGMHGINLCNVTNGTIEYCRINITMWGISLKDSNRIIIQNNNCTDNLVGMYLDSSDNNTIYNNSCSVNYYGINLNDGSDNNLVIDNICNSNDAEGISLSNSNNNSIENCICKSNQQGICVDFSIGNSIINCTCDSNTLRGMHFWSSDNNLIINCTCTLSGWDGILLEESDNNKVINCNCSNTSQMGINIWSSIKNTISNCICILNGMNGIVIAGSGHNVIENSTCVNNSGVGIRISSSFNNTLNDNNCNSNDWYGIELDTSSTNNFCQNITCSENMVGISIWTSDNNIIEDCLCNNNSNNGIYMTGSYNNLILNSSCCSNLNVGIYFAASYDSIIKNTSVNSNSQEGIVLEDSTNNTVTQCNLSSNVVASIYLSRSDGNAITDCLCNSNSDPWPNGLGIYLQNSDENIIANSTCSGNGWNGILLDGFYGSNNNTIENCTCNSNGQKGIALITYGYEGSDNNTIDNCTCNWNDVGISLDASDNNTIKNCICNSNNYEGIALTGFFSNGDRYGSDGNRIMNCTCNSNDYYGFWIVLAEDNLIERCNCSSNKDYGFYLTETFPDDSNYNTIRECTISSNLVTGIYIRDSESHKISDCLISRNWDYGIRLDDSSSNEITNNTFKDNFDYAIYIEWGHFSDIHHNFFINNNGNDVQALDHGGANRWDDFENGGNLWTDYAKRYVPPATHDGHVWDTPYELVSIHGVQDYYPLANYPYDIQPPEIIEDLTPSYGTTGDPFRFRCRLIDDIALREVYVVYWFGNNSNDKVNNSLIEYETLWDLTTLWNLTITLYSDSYELTYEITVSDYGNNWISTGKKTVTILDNDCPEITDHSDSQGGTGDPFMFKASVADNIDIYRVGVTYWYYAEDGGHEFNYELTNDGDNWTYEITLPFTFAGYLEYAIGVKDTAYNDNSTGFKTIEVFDNDAPIAVVWEDIECYLGQEVVFNGSFSYDNIGIQNYTWEFYYDVGEITLYGVNQRFRFDIIGSYQVRLTVRDGAGLEGNTTFYVNVTDWPDIERPEILDIVYPDPVYIGEEIMVTAKVIDDKGLAELFLEYKGVNGTTYNVTMNSTLTGGEWTHLIPGQETMGEVRFNVSATDHGNNWDGVHGLTLQVIEELETDPPFIKSSTPKNNSKDVAVDIEITITFSESMDWYSVLAALEVETYIDHRISWRENDTVLHITFVRNLTFDTRYNLSISSEAMDLVGNRMKKDFFLTFTTEVEPIVPIEDKDDDDRSNTMIWILILLAIIILLVLIGLIVSLKKRQKMTEEETKHIPVKRKKKKRRAKVPEEDDFEVVFSYYEFLDVSRDASEKEIKRAYRRKSKEVHPDAAVDLTPKEKKDLKKTQIELNKAKETLLDSEKRERYDISIGQKSELETFEGLDVFDEEIEKEEDWESMLDEEVGEDLDDEFPEESEDFIDEFEEGDDDGEFPDDTDDLVDDDFLDG